MSAGDICTNTWSVMPTGNLNDTFRFFVDYVPEEQTIDSKRTTTLNITIVDFVDLCEESWECDFDWSEVECINGWQNRTCWDNNDCGTSGSKPPETQQCAECTNETTQACTTTDSCEGTETCVNGFWGDCIDTANDNCPVLTCAEGEITEDCFCGTEIFNSGYCCTGEPQTTECIIPCDEYWTCEDWSSCVDGQQTTECIDNNDCGTTTEKPPLTQTCGDCTNGEIINCTSNQLCPGTQTCTNNSWENCIDTPNDNCPSSEPVTLKEFTVFFEPQEIKEGESFILTVLNEENNPLSGAKIRYSTKTYYTNSLGQVKLKTNTNYTEIIISRSGYKKQTIILNFRTDKCGNTLCETEFENEINCPADCKEIILPTEEELIIFTFKKEGKLIVKITDLEGKELEGVKVIYGTQTKFTNTQGLVDFTELIQTQNITAEKLGYQKANKIYNPETTCIEETKKDCEIEGCTGLQTCVNGAWGTCIDTPNDNCPTEENTTTLILGVILIIGIIIFVITKMKEK